MLRIFVIIISFLYSDVSLAGHNRAQKNHIRHVFKTLYFNNSNKLLAEGAESGRMRWKSEEGRLVLISVFGDKASSDALHNIFEHFDRKFFKLPYINYDLDIRVLPTIHKYGAGIKVYDLSQTDNDVKYRVTFTVFDRCADSFKTGSYSRSNWTNYLQAAGSIAGVLSTGKFRLPAKSCHYNSALKKIN